MSKIIIKNLNNKVATCLNDNSKTVLNILHENNIDWMHACGAKGRCTTCKMIVVEGMAHISPLTIFEERYKEKKQLAENQRLACQCHINDDIVIKVPESGKMPHLKYSD